MQQLQTITKKTTTSVESIHVDTVYTVLQNCFNNLQMLDADCTGSNYYINSANIYAQLLTLYAAHASSVDFISLQSVMQCFASNITYVDESSLFTSVVKNTVLQNILLEDYVYLCN